MKVLILIIIFILILPVTFFQEPEEGDLICRVAPDIIKRAHEFHGLDNGVDASVMDSEGRLYFWRDGKRCKLFTNDFLREEYKCQESQKKLMNLKH